MRSPKTPTNHNKDNMLLCKLNKYKCVNHDNPHEELLLESETLQEAQQEALDILGWGVYEME